jgi:hypothetical protein
MVNLQPVEILRAIVLSQAAAALTGIEADRK